MIDWDAAVLAPVMDVFGEEVSFLSRAGTATVVTGVFDEAFLSVAPNGDPGSATVGPMLGVRLSQFVSPPKQKDSVRISPTSTHGGGTYAIREVQPDSHGWAKLLLNYVGP